MSVTINGSTTDRLEQTFLTEADAVANPMVVSSWYGDVLLDREVVYPVFCDLSCAVWTQQWVSLMLLETGQLTFGSYECQGGGYCVGDWFCGDPECMPTSEATCGDGNKCSLRTPYDEPGYRYITCVPDGAVPVGGACTQGTVGFDTGFDDCVAGALCVEGSCRRFCSNWEPCPAAQTCVSLDLGWPQQFGVCQLLP